jgi:hypothetical protein
MSWGMVNGGKRRALKIGHYFLQDRNHYGKDELCHCPFNRRILSSHNFLSLNSKKNHYGEQVKEGEMGRACSTHGVDKKYKQNFDRKT